MLQIENKKSKFTLFMESVPQKRDQLLPALWACQNEFGYISEENAADIGKAVGAPMADVQGVIEFYSLFYTKPEVPTRVRVCKNCHNKIYIPQEDADGPAEYKVDFAECLDLCDRAEGFSFGDPNYVDVALDDHEGMLLGKPIDPGTEIYGDSRPLTQRCGVIAPTDIDAYKENKGFVGLKRAFSMLPIDLIEQVKASGLKGRGGAAFPTGIKWEGAANAIGDEKYIVCNADESEPGTFKDRVVIEQDPFSIIEGIIIGAYAIGAQKGYVYMRGEYPKARQIFDRAIAKAREAGYLGENIQGSGFDFELELRAGAGAYICGEETSLFESIEGKRGYPRIKPPYPTTHGLFNKPTVINNAETFANVTLIVRDGVSAYKAFGSEDSSGPRLFSLSGDLTKPGIYEITEPITLQALLDQAGATDTMAVLLGGAAGDFVPADKFDFELTFEGTREAGLSLGSGVVMAFNSTRDLRKAVTDLGRFFQHESCGKCYPCQLGTQRQLEILVRVEDSAPLPGDLERLSDVGWTMTDASLCGLGQTAATAVLSVMEHWPELFK